MPKFPYSHTLPFFLYLLFLALAQWLGSLHEAGQAWVVDWDLRWLYPVKVLCVAALLWHFRNCYTELKSFAALTGRHWLAAVSTGVVVFVLWINLDVGWGMLASNSSGFNPTSADGSIDWRLVIARWLGAAIVVPVMEELFWRSFLMRWLDQVDFRMVSPARISLRALLVASLLFGFEHQMWFAGILAGLAYAWLYRRTAQLWATVVAHGVTNGLLGFWVLYTGNWQFW